MRNGFALLTRVQAYLILATVLGAVLGHFIFSGTVNVDALLREEGRGLACH